ncbi:hypothetical protein SESBI_02358 [Sesbania bispinosa]|nr:hypothetical protein SESBI_02358 [Sesbania bispinosa]
MATVHLFVRQPWHDHSGGRVPHPVVTISRRRFLFHGRARPSPVSTTVVSPAAKNGRCERCPRPCQLYAARTASHSPPHPPHKRPCASFPSWL